MVMDSSTLFGALNTVVASGTDIGARLAELEGSGLFLLVLPFLLVFAIVYGLLESLELFDDNKPSVIIALVIATFAAVYFPMGEWLAFLQGPWGMWLVLILMVMITLELAGFSPGEGGWSGRIIGIVAVLGVVALFLMGDPNVLQAIFGTDFGSVGLEGVPIIGDIPVGTLLILLVAAGLVAWMADIGPAGGG